VRAPRVGERERLSLTDVLAVRAIVERDRRRSGSRPKHDRVTSRNKHRGRGSNTRRLLQREVIGAAAARGVAAVRQVDCQLRHVDRNGVRVGERQHDGLGRAWRKSFNASRDVERGGTAIHRRAEIRRGSSPDEPDSSEPAGGRPTTVHTWAAGRLTCALEAARTANVCSPRLRRPGYDFDPKMP